MNTKTRKEKFEEARQAIKKSLVLLALTAVMIVMMALGLSLRIEKSRNEDLQHQIVELENNREAQDTGASYDVIYVERR